MLVSAAAAQWGVDASALRTSNGFVVGPGGKKLGYGALAEAAMKQPDTVQLLAQYRELATQPGNVAIQADMAPLAGAAHKISAEFVFPYLAHAPKGAYRYRPHPCPHSGRYMVLACSRNAASVAVGSLRLG